MLFTITKIEAENNITLISGNTGIGRIKGLWKSKEIPVIGKHYQIELDFGIIDRSLITIHNEPTEASSEIIEDGVIFTAECEDIDEIYYLRFAFDGLEMLDIEQDDFTIKKGDYISFSLRFSEIGIYPY